MKPNELIDVLEYTLVYINSDNELKMFFGKESNLLSFIKDNKLKPKTYCIFEPSTQLKKQIHPVLPIDNELDLEHWFLLHRKLKAN